MALSLPQHLLCDLNFYCVLRCFGGKTKKTPFNLLLEMLVHRCASLIFPVTSTVEHVFPPVAIILMAEGILHFAKLCLHLLYEQALSTSTPLFCALSLNFENALQQSHLSKIALNNMTTSPLSARHTAELM